MLLHAQHGGFHLRDRGGILGGHLGQQLQVFIAARNFAQWLDDRAHILQLGDRLLSPIRIVPEVGVVLLRFEFRYASVGLGVVKETPSAARSGFGVRLHVLGVP
jgi:hypothetical protein